MDAQEAGLVMNLVRYEHDNPGYVKRNWDKVVIRPFLTPTPGVVFEEGKDEQINTCVSICREVNTTTHLAVWRRYLRTVWSHN